MDVDRIIYILGQIDAERDEITRDRINRKTRVNGSHLYKEGATPAFISNINLGSHPQEVV